MKKGTKKCLWLGLLSACMMGAFVLAGCGDDVDDFTPVSKNRGYDYAVTSPSGLSEYPCNEMREGRDAVVGRDKDMYTCIFDRTDSVYLWAGKSDTLTAKGREFVREESSSSEESSDSESSSSRNSSSSYSSSYSSSSYSSSYSSSSSRSSSSSYSSSSMRSSSSMSSSSSQAVVYDTKSFAVVSKEDFFNPDIDYGTMTDPRDGKVYRTVDVGPYTWMAENLNFVDSSKYALHKKNVRCYNDEEKNCDLLGRLYERAAAMNDERCVFKGPCKLGDGPIQGVCPDGWHIPLRSEAGYIVSLVLSSAKKVRSSKGWGNSSVSIEPGLDLYGLSFIGAGEFVGTEYEARGEYTHVWTYVDSLPQFYLLIMGEEDAILVRDYNIKELFYPVRCVKDYVVTSSSSSRMSSSSVSSSSLSSSSVPPSSSSAKSSSSVSSSSESSSSMSSSSTFDKTVLFNANASYGEMTDSRDGQTYRTLYIAGHTWMAENLNFADVSKLPILDGNSYCYDDDPDECAVSGRLYSREAALNDSRCTCYNGTCPTMSGNVQGVCPSGWHIPSKSEAEQLVNSVGNLYANKLNSTYGWETGYKGENSTGMSFVGSGVYRRQTGYTTFEGKGKYTSLWVYDASLPNESWYLLDSGKGTAGSGLVAVMDDAEYDPFFPVRCVKD